MKVIIEAEVPGEDAESPAVAELVRLATEPLLSFQVEYHIEDAA